MKFVNKEFKIGDVANPIKIKLNGSLDTPELEYKIYAEKDTNLFSLNPLHIKDNFVFYIALKDKLKFIKEIAPLNFTVGYRQMSETNEVEYWVICKEKDYSLLDKISELCIEYENKLPFRVGIVFTSIKQFVGKDIVTFEEEM